MEQQEFATRLVAEFARLGLSERDARFVEFGVDEQVFEFLGTLPDGMGPAAFYARVGADWQALQDEEREWIAMSDAERQG
ncbi:MAG TPA: hypothetical protein VGM67_16325 [Gemmatimonadaceae bacterium]|jgi:hypothetical protein